MNRVQWTENNQSAINGISKGAAGNKGASIFKFLCEFQMLRSGGVNN